MSRRVRTRATAQNAETRRTCDLDEESEHLTWWGEAKDDLK